MRRAREGVDVRRKIVHDNGDGVEMGKHEGRELIEIDPNEVSMVDLAANKRRFLVIKRLEDEMGNFVQDVTKKVELKKSATELADIGEYLFVIICGHQGRGGEDDW